MYQTKPLLVQKYVSGCYGIYRMRVQCPAHSASQSNVQFYSSVRNPCVFCDKWFPFDSFAVSRKWMV